MTTAEKVETLSQAMNDLSELGYRLSAIGADSSVADALMWLAKVEMILRDRHNFLLAGLTHPTS